MSHTNEFRRVTVIMPVRNEADFIAQSLGAVLKQDYPHDRLQVIVADGHSEDATCEIIQHLAAQHPEIDLKMLDNPHKIVPTGFNLALQQASGEIIIRVDGHTVIAPDYVRQCVAALANSDAACVGGRMNAIANQPTGEAIALATSTPFGIGGGQFHYSDQATWVDTVYMGAWPRQLFDELGGFDEELVRNQDDEFSYRLRAAGHRIWLDPTIISHYFCRDSIRHLWRQYYQYGFYKVRVMQKHPRQMRPRQFAPPLLVATVIGGLILAPFSIYIRILWLIALALYLTANLAASLYTARKAGWRHLVRLPPVFGVLHFSYGLGFWHGLIAFRNRWHKTPHQESPL